MNKILVVDDEESTRNTLSEVLIISNFSTVTASSGREAPDIFVKESPDAVLLDLRMPGMDGIETLKELKKIDPDVPVIIVTAHGDIPTAVKAINLGAYDFIVKPPDFDILILSLKRAIHKYELTKERNSLHEDLEVMVRRLQNEISEHKRTEKALLKARDASEIANRAKGDFLANVSHELTTPLNSIIGFSQVLQDELYGELNEKQKGYVNDILGSGMHLMGLINDMLDLAKIEAGEEALKTSKFPLRDILKSSMTALNEAALKKDLKLSLVIEPDADLEIKADATKLNQIIFNLLSNAVKFTQPGGSVQITARRVSSPGKSETDNSKPATSNSKLHGNFVEISVSDTGIGIKSEDIPKLFQEFVQLESPYVKKYEGAGIGLILVKRLVELHGGKVWVESEPEKGSTFGFVIPVRQ